MGSPTEPTSSSKPTGTTRSGRCRLLSELLPSSTAMTGAILGSQLDPGAVAVLLEDLSAAGAQVLSGPTSATFQLDQDDVTGIRTYPKIATLTTLDLALLAHQGLLVEVSLYRGRREIFRGRFEEPHPTGDLVNLIDGPGDRWRHRWDEFVHAVRPAVAWMYGGFQASGACFGCASAARSPHGPRQA
ncbi:hypothetical protein [Cellulomonas sp. URHD0024]|uniref:hypothetical protein n=1 Tax=Cellulomonas sp. URHD0024 TaxID=1302620 RepID=UPI0003F9B400|nr:hypothetical protein [Cellulomonas sp. URHD0024]